MILKSLITTLLAIGLVSPQVTYASWIDDMIESAKAGNGTYTESHSSVSTGGVRAANSESVGDSSASSHVETYINAGGSGGEVKVKIETSKNGVKQTQEYEKKFAPGESVYVQVATSSKSGGTQIGATTRASAKADARTASSINASTTALIKSESRINILFSTKLPSLFKKVFSFFWGF